MSETHRTVKATTPADVAKAIGAANRAQAQAVRVSPAGYVSAVGTPPAPAKAPAPAPEGEDK